MRIEAEVPLRVLGRHGGNTREHWAARHRRGNAWRLAVADEARVQAWLAAKD